MPLPEAEERTIPRAEQNHFGLHDSQIYVQQSKSSMMDRLTDHGAMADKGRTTVIVNYFANCDFL